jgi:hypothetical protein
MWARTSSQYHSEAAHYYRVLDPCLVLNRDNRATVFWLGDEEVPPDACDSVESEAFLPIMVSALRRRMTSRTKGLLEVSKHKDGVYRVDYMHRTAKDRVVKSKGQVYNALASPFDVSLWVLKAEVLLNGLTRPGQLIDGEMEHAWTLLHIAAQVADTPTNRPAIVAVLKKLAEQLRAAWEMLVDEDIRRGTTAKPPIVEYHLPDWCIGQPPIEGITASGLNVAPLHCAVNFLGVAAQIPIPCYVNPMVLTDPDILVPGENVVSVLENAVFGASIDLPSMRSRQQAMEESWSRKKNDQSGIDLVRLLVAECQDLDLLETILVLTPVYLVEDKYLDSVLNLLRVRIDFLAGGTSITEPLRRLESTVSSASRQATKPSKPILEPDKHIRLHMHLLSAISYSQVG